MEYKVEVTHKKADFVNFSKAIYYQALPFQPLRIAYKIAKTFIGGTLILTGISVICLFIREVIIKGEFIEPFAMVSLFILFQIFALFMFNYKLLGRLSWKKYNRKDSKLKYNFYDSEFTEHTPTSEHKYNYSVIKNIYEDKVAYYLFIDKSRGYIISKLGFIDGDSNQFATFISEKTGLKIVKIK